MLDPAIKLAWASKDGGLIKKVLSGDDNIDFNLPNGDYVLEMASIDSFGNKKTISESINITGVGLEDKVLCDDFKIYPNPSEGWLIIQARKYALENI